MDLNAKILLMIWLSQVFINRLVFSDGWGGIWLLYFFHKRKHSVSVIYLTQKHCNVYCANAIGTSQIFISMTGVGNIVLFIDYAAPLHLQFRDPSCSLAEGYFAVEDGERREEGILARKEIAGSVMEFSNKRWALKGSRLSLISI